MQQLLYFLKKIRYLFLFIVLELVAFALVQNQYNYHRSVVHAVTGDVFFSISSAASAWRKYFSFPEENERLAKENAHLRSLLAVDDKHSPSAPENMTDTTQTGIAYNFIAAGVIKNSFDKQKNYIVLDRGAADGVEVDDGVVTDKGVVGVIVQVTPHYAVCRSILHIESYVSARFKKNNYYGSIDWEGGNRKYVNMLDVPRVADVVVGDTVITDKRSTLFPEGLIIGTVSEFGVDQSDFYDIKVLLADDFASLSEVYVIHYRNAEELKTVLDYEK
ncbi:MAG: rod shape-determining protein MreC [Flavobacteriales bacterium]|nr:rod shape-determining protein MreC [Flavobacteriales bacterium]